MTSGRIGSDANAWNIGSNNIYNGTNSLTSTTAGAYFGIDGIRIYADDKNSFTYKKTGALEIKKGMTSIDDTSNTSGMFIGDSGISLGGGKLKLTKAGSLTSKDGEIAGWNIGTSSLSKTIMNGSTVSSHVGMSSNGTYAFFAGQDTDPADCAFKVSKEGKVWLTKLFCRTVNTSAPGYDPDDPTTWTWVDSEVSLGENAYKIAGNNATVASIDGNGKVRLSDGRSFNTATSVSARGSWSGATLTVKPQYYRNSQWVDSGGSSYTTSISAAWEKPYELSTNNNIYNVYGGSTLLFNSGEISLTKEYSSSYHNYSLKVFAGTEQILSTSTDTSAYTDIKQNDVSGSDLANIPQASGTGGISGKKSLGTIQRPSVPTYLTLNLTIHGKKYGYFITLNG